MYKAGAVKIKIHIIVNILVYMCGINSHKSNSGEHRESDAYAEDAT